MGSFIAALCLLAWPLCQSPDLHGLATHYGPPAFLDGDVMRNGEPLDLSAPMMAVDDSHWPEWKDAAAWVLTECGTVYRVRVTDTGRLYQIGGWLRLGIRQEQLRYWPVQVKTDTEPVLLESVVETKTEWLDDKPLRVVADFPERFYAKQVACKAGARGQGDTMKVWLWVR